MKWISILIWLLFWGAMLYSQNAPTSNESFKVGFNAYQDGNYVLALQNYNQAIDLDPARSAFYYNRGLVYKAIGNDGRAIADFVKANELMPDVANYYQLGAIAYLKDDMIMARENLEKARSLKSGYENTDFYLGNIYYKNKQYAKGAACLEAFIGRVRNNTNAIFICALCEARSGNISAAAQNAKYVNMDWGNDPKYLYSMYELYSAIGDNQQAANNLTMLIETGQRKPDYYKQRAALYLALGNQAKSDEDLATLKQLQEPVASK